MARSIYSLPLERRVLNIQSRSGLDFASVTTQFSLQFILTDFYPRLELFTILNNSTKQGTYFIAHAMSSSISANFGHGHAAGSPRSVGNNKMI